MDKPIIHMLADGKDGIEAVQIEMRDSSVQFALSWNRDQNRCGPFFVEIGELIEQGIKDFDLVLDPGIKLPIPNSLARMFPENVGLRPWKEGKGDLGGKIHKAQYGYVCYVMGAGTPYSFH